MIRFEEQEITDGSVTQDDTGTTLSFTRPLAPTDSGKETLSATPGDQHQLIYAFGSDNELGNHGSGNRGVALLDLFCGDSNDSVSAAPSTSPPTESPASEDGGGLTVSAVPTPVPTPVQAGEDEAAEDTDAAPRVSGGLWIAAATITVAMLGAAMSL